MFVAQDYCLHWAECFVITGQITPRSAQHQLSGIPTDTQFIDHPLFFCKAMDVEILYHDTGYVSVPRLYTAIRAFQIYIDVCRNAPITHKYICYNTMPPFRAVQHTILICASGRDIQ